MGKRDGATGFFGGNGRTNSEIPLQSRLAGNLVYPGANPAAWGESSDKPNFAEQLQQDQDVRLSNFFGSYLTGNLNWFHRNVLARSRLMFHSGPFEKRYYDYCFPVKSPISEELRSYSVCIDLTDHAKPNARRLLASILPTLLPVNTPDARINRRNAATNQANGLLEERMREFIRDRLKALTAEDQDLRNGKVYDRLMTECLSQIQDPNVKWTRVSDAGIVAGLLLEEELSLYERFAFSPFATSAGSKSTVAAKGRDDVDLEAAQTYAESIFRQPPVYRPVVKIKAKGALPTVAVVLPEQEENYYLKPVPVSQDEDGAAVYNLASAEYIRGLVVAADEGVEDPQYTLGTMDEREEDEPKYTLGNIEEPEASDKQSRGSEEPGDSVDSGHIEAGGSSTVDEQEQHYDNLGPEGMKSEPVAPPRSPKKKPVLSTVILVPNPAFDESELAAEDYLDVSPAVIKKDEENEENEEAYEEIPELPGVANATPAKAPPPPKSRASVVSQQGNQGRRPTASSLVYSEQEAPIPPNPFKKPGDSDSKLLPDTLHAELVRAIRKAVQCNQDLGEIVRDQVQRLVDESYSAPELNAIRIVTHLAMREVSAVGFNYLAGLSLTDEQYDILFVSLVEAVSSYRQLFAAPAGSVAANPKAVTLNDNMENIAPFMTAFIRLYLAELKNSNEQNLQFQFSIVAPDVAKGKKVKDNFFVVIKRAKKEGGCDQVNYKLVINDETGHAEFKPKKDGVLTSYRKQDLHQAEPTAVESFGEDSLDFHFRSADKKYNVLAGAQLKPPRSKALRDEQIPGLSVALPDALLKTIGESAIQDAYNKQRDYTAGQRLGRWVLMHPKTMLGAGAAVIAGGAAAGAYAAGFFDAPPCKGYTDNLGRCVQAELPDPDCSIQMGSTDVLEGGSVKLTPICANSQAFAASSQSFVIRNIPTGAIVTINGESVTHLGGDFDVSQHIDKELTVTLPDGFSGAWTPQAVTGFTSGSKTFSGTASASEAVKIEPVAGTATVSLTDGSFTGLVENANATFTMRWNAAAGDAGVNKYVKDLQLGDRLYGKAANGAIVYFEATAANNGTGLLAFAGLETEITYVPAPHVSGNRQFKLYARSVDGSGVDQVVGPPSPEFNVAYTIKGIADLPSSVVVPNTLYTVEGQFSAPFNLSAVVREGDLLQRRVILPAGASLCGTFKTDNSVVCFTNNNNSPQEIDISTWNDAVTYKGNPSGVIFRARGAIDASVSPWVDTPLPIDQLQTPSVAITQGNSSVPLSQVNGIEDTAMQFTLKVDLYNAVNGSVVLQFPTVTSPFAAGKFQVNGTRADGLPVSFQVTPGSSLDVSGLRLDMPLSVQAPKDVNRGNQAGNLNIGLQVTSYADGGRSTTASSAVGMNVAPVADRPTFDFGPRGNGLYISTSLPGVQLRGNLSSTVPGEVITSDNVLFSNLPNGTLLGVFEQFAGSSLPPQYPPVSNLGNNSFAVPVNTFKQTRFFYYLKSANGSYIDPGSQVTDVTASVSVDDYGDVSTFNIHSLFGVNAPVRRSVETSKKPADSSGLRQGLVKA